MKLLLCSEAFYTPNTVQACVELCGKPQNKITIAIINEAYAVQDGDKYWVLDNLNDVAKNFNAGIDIINLLALPIEKVEERIAVRDVICVLGGHVDYLMHVFEKTGFSKLLPKLLEDKVYVGSSAGSKVAGRKITNATFNKQFGKEDTYGTEEYLRLVDFSIVPHMNNKSEQFANRKPEILRRASKGIKTRIYGLQDDSAIIVNGNKQSFTGPEPYRIN